LKRESKYNLSDDDEDEINIHNTLLSENDDFDEEVPLDDGSDEEGTTIIISGWNTIFSSCYNLSI
jgi:nucleolar protein 14